MLHGSTNKLKNGSIHLIFTLTLPKTEFSSIFVQKLRAKSFKIEIETGLQIYEYCHYYFSFYSLFTYLFAII